MKKIFVPISELEITEGSPLLSNLAFRMRDNPISAAQFDATAIPILRHENQESLTGSGVWTVPDEVERVKVILSGGGGGGGSGVFNDKGERGADGADTTFGSLTAPGGRGGVGVYDSSSVFENGPTVSSLNGLFTGAQGGAPGGFAQEGSPGGMRIEIVDVTPLQNISYSIGSGGAGATYGINAKAGRDGFILIED